jgi:hypothetical protein
MPKAWRSMRIEDPAGQDDPVPRDRRERADRQRRALVVVEVARAQLEHPAAVDVAFPHQLPELTDDLLGAAAFGRHDLELHAFSHAPVLAVEHEHQRAVAVAHEPEAGLHARDALVLAQRHGHVLDGAEGDLLCPFGSAGQLGEPGPVPVNDRQSHQFDLPAGRPRVDRHLEVRPVPARQVPGDDRDVHRIAAEVLAQPAEDLRLGAGRAPLRPLRQPLERIGELRGFHPRDAVR